MGKNLNLNNLTPEEAHQILEVIQKDFEIRQKEKERLSKIEEDVSEEENRTSLLRKNTNFNKNCCIRCCETFGIIFNRKQTCRKCQLNVCKACCHYDDSIKGYICKACLKDHELKTKSFDWFYKNVSEKFKRFGSAKVVRSLYKHADMGSRGNKYHSDNESDSGYDPSLYSSFGQSGSYRGIKQRPSLSAVFPDIVITDEEGKELDNGLIPPPLLSPNNNSYQKSPTPSLDNRNLQQSPRTPTPLVSQENEILDNKEKEKRDIYREAFENTKRTEEAKFKIRFDNLLSDMTKSIEKQSPRDGRIPAGFGSTSYGELMTTYRGRIKDLLVSLSQRLELAVESFDESSPHSPMLTSQKVRQMISKLIEDRLGETLDLTSDEAVSDLSSLSDESGEQKSFEDQIAQAVIAKILEQHRHTLQNVTIETDNENEAEMDQQTDSSGSEDKMVNRTMSSSFSDEKNVIDSIQTENMEKNLIVCDNKLDKNQNVQNGELDYTDSGVNVRLEEDDEIVLDDNKTLTNDLEREESGQSDTEENEIVPDEREILQKEFEKLRTFAHEVVPRPLYEEVKMEEEVEQEPIVEEFDKVQVSHEESQEEFSTRFFTYDKVHDQENRGLPDFSYLEDDEEHYFGVDEVDPDLLSMNLAPIVEETEEELEDDKEDETQYEQDWRGNWIFKGAQGISPYSNLSKKKVGGDFADIYMTIPQPNNPYNPRIGSRDVDDMSDLSENDDRDSLDGLSDEENTFYAKTSEEIARITRKNKRTSSSTQASVMANTSVQTEDESEAESLVSRPLSSSFSDSGVKSSKMDHNSFDSRTSESLRKKLSEELIPAEGDDPKFEIPPDSVSVPEGEPAKLTCRVAGTQPLDVFWYRVNEETEELENSENYEITKDGGRHHLTMFNMTKNDHGQYMCMAINEKGRCCQYFILNIKKNTQELKAPEFLKTLSDVEVAEGESVKFRCKVKGYPQPRVTWYKDGQLLRSELNCKLEKFGNRDYLLVIETASMEEDAEYSVLAKNIAGEVRSSAQLIVEPKHKPETEATPTASRNTSKREPEQSTPNIIPRLPYLPSSRKSPAATRKTSPTKSKDEQNLSNLSQKVSMTKESVANVAEDMLSSTKELTEINQSIAAMDKILAEIENDIGSSVDAEDLENNNGVTALGSDQSLAASHKFWVTREAAENVRKVTSSALDILDSADSVILREKNNMDALATSTPRSSVSEKLLISEDVSNVEEKLTQDTLNTSADSHTSEISFNFAPVTSKPVSKVLDKDSNSHVLKTETQSSRKLQAQTVSPKITVNSTTDISQQETSPDVKTTAKSDLNNVVNSQNDQSSDSESLFLNFGPKRENKEWYERDFYITNTPKLERRKSSESSDKDESPRTEKQRAHTEEKIYLAAGNVYNLENKVLSLADKVKAVNALAEQDKMERLEDQVARTVAKVAHTEREVKDVEKSVTKLKEPKQPTFKSKMAPPKPRPITPPQEKPEPTFLKGTTNEQDLPESRTEFNEEYGSLELPSVHRLKAMFGQSQQAEKDSSIRRIHSITARSVPKEQLEKLRRNSEEDKQTQNVSSKSAENQPRNPGRATALTTGQQIKHVPEHPKQVFQSSNVTGQQSSVTAGAKIQKSQTQTLQSSQKPSASQTQSTSNTAKTQPMKITLANNINRPLSPVQSETAKQTHQPVKTHVTGKVAAPKPPSQSNVPTQKEKSGSEIDTPEGRKSPKIRSGAISAMSKFWEKRLTDGTTEEEYPELLENN